MDITRSVKLNGEILEAFKQINASLRFQKAILTEDIAEIINSMYDLGFVELANIKLDEKQLVHLSKLDAKYFNSKFLPLLNAYQDLFKFGFIPISEP